MTSILPLFLNGQVVPGFGRGSKELGCPTANLDDACLETLPSSFENGIYFGWSQLNSIVYPAVMSIGQNPFYGNTRRTIEVHLLHKFEHDFYGANLKCIVVGYLRPEKNFSNVGELIDAIDQDIEQASAFLRTETFSHYEHHDFFGMGPSNSGCPKLSL